MDINKATIYTRGLSKGNPGPSAIGVQVIGEEKILLELSETIGNAFDDYAEYFAVVRALQALSDNFKEKTQEISFVVKLESELVKKQLNSECEINNPSLVPLFMEIHNLRISNFPNLFFKCVKSGHNKEAARLVNEALGS